MAIYRDKYLKQETIAVIKESKKEMFSKGSITWLNTFKNVQHALNGREINICGEKVDGFNKETNTVYEYQGFFWHGCPKCYNEDTINNTNHESVGDLYEKTKERNKQITDNGFTLIEMWECNWVKSKEYKTTIKNSDDIVEPSNPRDAFYGGRTNASKFEVQNKKLQYIDVCSLYPTL
jgi:G:T-mismatch repair DNA endonuclease (very short patch repair protein)